jgi:hypothetical protein
MCDPEHVRRVNFEAADEAAGLRWRGADDRLQSSWTLTDDRGDVLAHAKPVVSRPKARGRLRPGAAAGARLVVHVGRTVRTSSSFRLP